MHVVRRKRLSRVRRPRRRPHDMWGPTDYDFPDDYEIDDWMIGQPAEGS